MAEFKLADVGFLKSWVTGLNDIQDEELDNCLAAATREIQGITGRVYEYKQVSETLHGNDAQGRCGDILPLSRAYAPIDTAVPVVVTENGVTVTTSFVYSTSAGAFVDVGPATSLLPTQPRLRRRGSASLMTTGGLAVSGWCPGLANITATWTGGYKVDATHFIPLDLQKLCAFMANEIFKAPTRAGKTSRSGQGGSASFMDDLPKWCLRILNTWTLK